MNRILSLFFASCSLLSPLQAAEAEWKAMDVKPVAPSSVNPMTGIVLWCDSPHTQEAPVQLEFFYIPYSSVMKGPGVYDWTAVEKNLTEIAKRKHQAIFRFWDTYPDKESGVPKYIRDRPDWKGRTALSEGKPTGFPDWSNTTWQAAHLDFFTALAKRYDKDPRVAFLQCGFGLWSEYHIYDGPYELGLTFPDRAYQEKFLKHMGQNFHHLKWSTSINLGDKNIGPIHTNPKLLSLPFGVFDDSFLNKNHSKYNAPHWTTLGKSRWKKAPAGGEFSYYTEHDQKTALSKNGPHGESFKKAASRYHISYMMGNDQPKYVSMNRIREAGKATGYRFQLRSAERNGKKVRLTFRNTGVAPIYYDAYPAYAGIRAKKSLKGLNPGKQVTVTIPAGNKQGAVTIQSDRLVKGQKIGFSVRPPRKATN